MDTGRVISNHMVSSLTNMKTVVIGFIISLCTGPGTWFFVGDKSFLPEVFDKLKSLNQIKPVKNNIPSPQLFINSHTKLLRCIEDHRRESARHFRVQSDLDTSLYLVLTLDE
mgnify:CR=1 FL=1